MNAVLGHSGSTTEVHGRLYDCPPMIAVLGHSGSATEPPRHRQLLWTGAPIQANVWDYKARGCAVRVAATVFSCMATGFVDTRCKQ